MKLMTDKQKPTSIANSVPAAVVQTKRFYRICHFRFCLLKSCVKNNENRTLLQSSFDVDLSKVGIPCHLLKISEKNNKNIILKIILKKRTNYSYLNCDKNSYHDIKNAICQ